MILLLIKKKKKVVHIPVNFGQDFCLLGLLLSNVVADLKERNKINENRKKDNLRREKYNINKIK